MSSKAPQIFLDDMVGAIEKIERYTESLSEADFKQKEMVIDAVLRNLEVLGEAAANIPEWLRLQ